MISKGILDHSDELVVEPEDKSVPDISLLSPSSRTATRSLLTSF